jgi:hypothetical protein
VAAGRNNPIKLLTYFRKSAIICSVVGKGTSNKVKGEGMDRRVKVILSAACITLFTLGSVSADLSVTVDPAPGYSGWIGYMNVSEIPQNGGAYVFGSGWGTADLKAVFTGPVLTLSENNVGDPNPFWYTPSGGPGAIGNKMMDASMYVEIGSLPGQTLTFDGTVLANSLLGQTDALGNGWTSVAFIKDFAPDYSSFVSTTVSLASLGNFSISLATVNDPARHVQYGFETIGPDVWATDAGLFGDIQITAIPEPSSIVLVMTGLMGFVAFAWKRRS